MCPEIVYFLANTTLQYQYQSLFVQTIMKDAFLNLVPRVHYFAEVEEFDEYLDRRVKRLMRRVDTSLDDDITRGGIIQVMVPDA